MHNVYIYIYILLPLGRWLTSAGDAISLSIYIHTYR